MEKKIELNDFQLRSINIYRYLYEHNAMSDEITDILQQQELDYFSLINKNKILESKVNVDEKTNLLKYKNDYLTHIIKTASRIYSAMTKATYNVSFIRFDIDDFSKFNNQYGHDIGDNVLVEVADILKTNSRPTDYPIRFGGEEFDVILPSTEIEGAKVYLEKIFKEIRTLKIPYGKKKLSVRVSAGATSMKYQFMGGKFIQDNDVKKCFVKLQKEADDALYEAKYTGKDRWVIYEEKNDKLYKKYRKLYRK